MYKYVVYDLKEDCDLKKKVAKKRVILTGKINDPKEDVTVISLHDYVRFYRIKNSDGTIAYVQDYRVDGFIFKPL